MGGGAGKAFFRASLVMNIDFDEDKKKIPSKSFLKYSRELSTNL